MKGLIDHPSRQDDQATVSPGLEIVRRKIIDAEYGPVPTTGQELKVGVINLNSLSTLRWITQFIA